MLLQPVYTVTTASRSVDRRITHRQQLLPSNTPAAVAAAAFRNIPYFLHGNARFSITVVVVVSPATDSELINCVE